jgi:hypothetical protein
MSARGRRLPQFRCFRHTGSRNPLLRVLEYMAGAGESHRRAVSNRSHCDSLVVSVCYMTGRGRGDSILAPASQCPAVRFTRRCRADGCPEALPSCYRNCYRNLARRDRTAPILSGRENSD